MYLQNRKTVLFLCINNIQNDKIVSNSCVNNIEQKHLFQIPSWQKIKRVYTYTSFPMLRGSTVFIYTAASAEQQYADGSFIFNTRNI